MSAKSHSFGHSCYYDWTAEQWRYSDSNEFIIENPRLCPQCKQPPTVEGYDPCIGFIQGANSVCCGHGVGAPFIVLEVVE